MDSCNHRPRLINSSDTPPSQQNHGANKLTVNLYYVTSSLPCGPGEAFFLPEIAELSRQGHQVSLVPLQRRGPVFHKDAAGLRYLEPRLLTWTILITALAEAVRAPLRTLRAAARLCRSRNLRILARNFMAFPKALWIARELRRGQADHVHGGWATVAATVAMVASELSGVPWSFTAHRWDILENNLLQEKLIHARFARFVSKDGLAAAAAPKSKAHVVYLGISLPEAPQISDQNHQVLRLLCPASLTPVKGHRYLLEAVTSLKNSGNDCRLMLAGEGTLRSSLAELVDQLGLQEQVQFLGCLAHEKLLDLYDKHQVDATVLPSLHEGIPVSLIEAMGFGVPVIGTMAGGTPELLSEGAGLLVPPADANALADAISLLGANPGLRRKLGAAGRKRVEQEFDVRHTVRELVCLMQPKSAAISVSAPVVTGALQQS